MTKRTLTILDNGQRIVAENLTFSTALGVEDHADITDLPEESFTELEANHTKAKVQRDHTGTITGVRIGRRVLHFSRDNHTDSQT